MLIMVLLKGDDDESLFCQDDIPRSWLLTALR
jgi:hypothetical protein